MILIYPNNQGPEGTDGITIVVPAPNFMESLVGMSELDKMIHLADKDLPSGTPYEIVDEILEDYDFRNAWEYVAGAEEKTSLDLSIDDQLKYNKITQEEYDASNG